jgi:tetratricopeptide (TPR) repeat protein
MAGQHAAPEQYRKRLGVDYILEGNVRRDGDQVLVAVSLTRTADGVSIWDHAFRGRLGDPLALQEAVAKGIEGQLRGRLAQGGGRRAEQIATSPEVYSLYSEGRSILRERTPGSGRRAQVLLQKAVSLDPNYAPAWAALAETYHFTSMRSTEAAGPRDAALADARRALALAPNLAEAHAAYAFFVGINSVQGERELRLAVALDPGHVEAWNWLGNALNAQYRPREAVAAYEKAVAADPMWLPAVANLGQTYSDLGDQKAFDALAARVQRAGGSEDLTLALRTNNAAHRGDLSGAVAPVLRFRSRSGGCDFACYEASLALIQLGYDSEAVRLGGFGESFGPLLRGDALPAASFRGAPVGPQDFWLSSEYSGPAVRALINLGHERDVIQRYRAAFGTTDQAIDQLTASGLLTALAPAVAVALCDSAQRGEAAYLLTTAARPLESVVASDRGQRAARFDLARIRAAQGRSGDALQLLEGSVGAGWLPDGLSAPMDIGQDPAFRALRGDARFEAMRKRILDHVAKERAELGPVRI